MSARIDHTVTAGTFSLDGQTFDVENNVWVVGDDAECIVVDAPHDVAAIRAVVGDRAVRAVVCTHAHDDHVRYARELADAVGAPVWLHPDDRVLWDQSHDAPPDADLADGQVISVGGVDLVVLHTPGHSPGSVCLYSPTLETVFTGDTLFEGGPGATGRSYSSWDTILESINGVLFTLPDVVVVRTGHGPTTTIGAERFTVPPVGEREARMRDVTAPIGIFDSGFGGLTVARAVWDQLPAEDTIYLGDTARAPYGPLPISEAREYALECLDHLYEMGVKALVIACNTASAAVLRDARERYDVPVIEVILPAARRAVRVTKSGQVGLICTVGTAMSQSYDDAMAAVPGVRLHTAPCPMFVEYVERGITGGPELLMMATAYLTPLQQAGIDTLILGCTHYPLLTGVLSYVLGDEVTLVSSSEECAKEVYRTLTTGGLARSAHTGERQFLTTGNPDRFSGIGRRLIGSSLDEVVQLSALR